MSSPFFRSPAFKAALKRSYATPPASTSTPSVESVKKGAESALDKAQKTATDVLAAAQKAAGPTGDKVAAQVSSVSSVVTRQAKIVGAFAKQVYVAEKLAPPTSVGELVGGWATIWSRATNPSYIESQIKNGGWKIVALYAVQLYGIFQIGECIGKRKLVGYGAVDNFPVHPPPHAAHH